MGKVVAGAGNEPAQQQTGVISTAQYLRGSGKPRRVSGGVIALVVFVAATAFAAGWNPPTTRVHTFTRASDYNAEKESGCTNSGEGCHGKEVEYRDFNAYHEDAECGTCHEYTGVGCIPCHAPSQHECALCHDGTMKGASDVVGLTDDAPNGHFSEETHTATSERMGLEMRAAEEGAALAKCSDCHSRELRAAHTAVPLVGGSTYGTEVSCGECHNDVRSRGQAEVIANWEARDCGSCHAATGSSAGMHSREIAEKVDASSQEGCGTSGAGCHDNNDLHGLHGNKPATCSGSVKEGEPGCHDLDREAHKPTNKDCGGGSEGACHRGYESGAYSHSKDGEVHSPTSTVPASDTSYYSIQCGRCHNVAADGVSLTDEHALATSIQSGDGADVCANCHENAASADAIANNWEARNTVEACEACHGLEDLPSAHASDLTALHTNGGSDGCAESGAGCHPTADLSEVGTPTTAGNLHETCLRCHDRAREGANLSYDPGADSCGEGRDCHAASGDYEPATSVHAGAGGTANGEDGDHHTAGSAQKAGRYVDGKSGLSVRCDSCHGTVLGIEHSRANARLTAAGDTLCAKCHNDGATTAGVVKAGWTERDGSDACAACHGNAGVSAPHGAVGTVHVATELKTDGTPAAGSCVTAGCHSSGDVRRIHRAKGCLISGCHKATGDIRGSRKLSCGGLDANTACHTGFSATNHFVSHSANLTDTVNGVTYVEGANVGCFGCHSTDLTKEHSDDLRTTSMNGGGSGTCRVCHLDLDDSSAGAYSTAVSVVNAIANSDRRCVACHSSGSKDDGMSAVASPHKVISAENTRPAGAVWADPFDQWKASFEATTGGGHNALSAAIVGASKSKTFPVTSFTVGPTVYGWSLPPNTGVTAWLDTAVYPSATTTENIKALRVSCEDCHVFGTDAAGPQGAAVTVRMDPNYSQTGWANPIPGESQFEATGTAQPICDKCHLMDVDPADATDEPGGNQSAHARHAARKNDATGVYIVCTDCHVRVPHAWKRPRLLVRTVVTADGVAPDGYPYVKNGHKGLVGVVLTDFTSQSAVASSKCATGGCRSTHRSTSHPYPSDIPAATYWP